MQSHISGYAEKNIFIHAEIDTSAADGILCSQFFGGGVV